jgi:cysteinyl-tRNA synthetase
MSGEVLGFPFDIHTGGIDHREIHHPNEIAQNQAHLGCEDLGHSDASGANIWMHNNFLVERTGKMSKSSGEFLRLQLLIDKGYHPLAYRMLCLQAHYRSELEFSWEGLGAALTRLKRMVMAVEKLNADLAASKQPEGSFPLSEQERLAFDDAISADLNTPEVLTGLEAILGNKKMPAAKRIQLLRIADELLGLNLLGLTRHDLRLSPVDALIDVAGIDSLIACRKEARAAKDFATSDAIRDELAAQGVEVMDGDPLEWEWKL